MIKEIKYKGLSAQPSDYECPDSDLAVSLNLINRDGNIAAISQPRQILTLFEDETLLFIHKVQQGNQNYILAQRNSESTFDIFWIKYTPQLENTEFAIPICRKVQKILCVEAVGNTLILALEDGLHYLLWKNATYVSLGDRPPFLTIDFGMCRVGNMSNSEEFSIPASCSPSWNGRRGMATKEDLASMTQMVYSLLNPAIAENVSSQGLFYQPFFVRYAYRLYDGSYCWHSAPILMLPTVTPPLIKYSDNGTTQVDDSSGEPASTVNASFTLDVNYFALAYRIISETALKNWEDIIAGVDIFVTPPIYTYDQSKDLAYRPVGDLRSILFSLYDWNPEDLSARANNALRPSSVFVGHYALDMAAKYEDHYKATAYSSGASKYILIPQNQKFHSNIRDAHEFYKIAEIGLSDLESMSSMQRLKLLYTDLSTLVTRERMSDDFQSHCRFRPTLLYGFNSRLNMSGLTIYPARPFTLRSSTQFSNSSAQIDCPKITVWTRKDGIRCHAVHIGKNNLDDDTISRLKDNFPRYIFYPDASAYKMEISIDDNNVFTLDLTPHDFLNGAYYYRADFGPDPIPLNAKSEDKLCPTSVLLRSKIYTSEVNNPFIFPPTGVNTVGTGEILGISSAAKALSQGQFGQFPLYAFSSEGIWALQTNSTGSYSAIQPISRDVCSNPSAITQIDSAVLFPTNRGIMLIEGSQPQCISETINTDFPFQAFSMPAMDTLCKNLSTLAFPDFSLAPFSRFLKDCGMIYDYNHQQIILFSKVYPYAYVYSLRSRLWGTMISDFQSPVKAYPEALAVNTSHRIVDFSQKDSEILTGLLVTRPLKLEAPDMLKTVDTVIQRGNFAKGHVQSLLYGSRDLINWHLVWTSKDHFMRGFRGTPYKYFRIACVTSLSEDESIAGASVQFTPRLTNQPR